MSSTQEISCVGRVKIFLIKGKNAERGGGGFYPSPPGPYWVNEKIVEKSKCSFYYFFISFLDISLVQFTRDFGSVNVKCNYIKNRN